MALRPPPCYRSWVDDDHSPSASASHSARQSPLQRRGWTWTLIKCAVATILSAIAGGLALFVVLRGLLGHLPGWLPASWAAWLFGWLLRHVWFVGPILGALVGLLVSTAIVVIDAKRGRLRRIA